jgi:hypothetical protein
LAVGAACVRSAWASAAACAAVARRATPLHFAARNGDADATAALIVAGADASIKDWTGYAAPRHTAAAAALVSAGGRQSNKPNFVGRAARTRWRCSRRAAAPLAIASTTPALGCAHFVHPTSTRSPQQCTQRLHRWSCALAPARLSVEHDAPDLPLVSAHACVFCSAAPSRTARGDQHVSWPYVHYSGCTAKAPSRARSRTSRVVLQANAHVAANEEVRPLAVRVRVRGGARRRTWRYQLGAK